MWRACLCNKLQVDAGAPSLAPTSDLDIAGGLRIIDPVVIQPDIWQPDEARQGLPSQLRETGEESARSTNL